MTDYIDEFFIKPMQFPDSYAPYNLFNTLAYAIIALLAAFLIYKYLKKKEIAIDPDFYFAILPFIFLGAVARVIQDAQILPRSLQIFGFTIYPFITPGIYLVIFFILAIVYCLSKMRSQGNSAKLKKSIRDSGIGLTLALFSLLAITKMSLISLEKIYLFIGILFFASLGLAIFELIKIKIYNKGETPQIRQLERTTMFSQVIDGAATFIGVTFGGYYEQHVVANTIFSFFGSSFSFYVIKIIFALAVLFILRKEAQDKDEHIYILILITIFGLAPGMRDGLRLLFSV
jgi:uncharacterized membrane protein